MSRMEAEKLAIDSALRYERNKERQKIRKEVEKIRATNPWKPETESDDYEGCMHEGYM